MTNPIISILMPTYNHDKYIEQAIESALKQQTEYPFELLINDDCSTDGTAQIVEKYAAKYPDKIRFFRQDKNQGLLKSYKFLLEKSQGKFVAVLESDDYWLDEKKLQKQISFLENNPEYGLCVSDVKIVNENGEETEVIRNAEIDDLCGNWYNRLLFSNFVHGGISITFRKSLYDSFIKIDDYIRRKFLTFDYPLLLTLAAHSKGKYIHEPLAAYRVLSTSISNNAAYEKSVAFEESILAIQKYIIEENHDIDFAGFSESDIFNYRYHVLCEKAWKNHRLRDFCKYARKMTVVDKKTLVLHFFPALWYFQHILRFSNAKN